MIITNAAILRLASASDEQKAFIYRNGIDYGAAIKKAKTIMCGIVEKETAEQLDELIAECSLPAAKQLHGEGMTLEPYG